MIGFWRRVFAGAGVVLIVGTTQIVRLSAASDVVLYASGASRSGNWSATADSTAAGGNRMTSADNGWSSPDGALASPGDFFELSFTASANTPYHVWVRLKAGSNSKYNDSVYLQWNDSIDSNGSALYRIGTTSALAVNLQTCNGCTLSGWGWVDGAYWLSQASTIRFANSGTHTIRVQTREDGVSIDQIVLGASSYLDGAPGQSSNDSTIVPATGTVTASSAGGSSSAYSGTPAAIPGTIAAADYDRGGEGIAYHDSGPNNAGGEYRTDGVDIELSSEGGYDVGWAAAGEWLNYSVNVTAAGSYTAQVRVASPNGGALHLGLNGSPSVWASVSVPSTGGWQAWTTVSVPVTLGAGTQVLTVMFDSGGVNFAHVKFSGGSTAAPVAPPSSSGPYGGSAASIPGKITLANFDNGGEGVAYHDTSAGNNGGAARPSTDVDIETSSEGGTNIGWTAAGEWLNYTVNASSSGSYTAQIRVSSPNGATLHIGFNGPSSVWTSVSVPSTGGWQSWTTVNVPVSLGAGQQVMTLMFDTGGVNAAYVNVVAGTTAPAPPPSGGGSSTTVTMADWNIQVEDPGATHARVAIDLLMQMGPRPKIITLQEAHQSQYNTYLDELQSQTGQTWYGVFRSHCPLGKWDGSSCYGSEDEGVALFSSYPIVDSGYIYFPGGDSWHSARAAVRAALNVNGMTVQAFSVHLQPNNATARYTSMQAFRAWAWNYSKPQIVGGDFNADADQIATPSGMTPAFVDTWSLAGSGNPFSAFLPSPFMKIDFIFSDASGKAAANASWIPWSTGSWSDHLPVLTTFTIRP